MTDPRFNDPRLDDPVVRREESRTGMWGWIAGIAVLALIAFVLVAGWNNNGSPTASNTTPAATSPAPSTTGSGATSPRPLSPPSSAPAPSDSGAR